MAKLKVQVQGVFAFRIQAGVGDTTSCNIIDLIFHFLRSIMLFARHVCLLVLDLYYLLHNVLGGNIEQIHTNTAFSAGLKYIGVVFWTSPEPNTPVSYRSNIDNHST